MPTNPTGIKILLIHNNRRLERILLFKRSSVLTITTKLSIVASYRAFSPRTFIFMAYICLNMHA